ncbi:MAG: LysM peptidoglycan-binding domain-containing protein [Bacteroidota bacterium]|nr:LysM peptidoglycan-binding domain-containing protein [Bacteroidota bacterium]
MNKIWVIVILSVGCFLESSAQNMTAEQYVQKYKDLAIREMKRMGVPAAITLAQGLLETENGNSDLLKKSNNHFGIKCKSSWNAGTVSHDDDAQGECFRVYKNAEESYRDHSNFLRGNDRYAFLFKLDPTDYKGWAYGLQKAGYATNPKYPEILIKNIETNNLEQYTLEAVDEVPVFDGSKYKSESPEKSADVVQDTDSETAPQPAARLSVNGSRALFASKGTSLLAIATENNINLARLLNINDLTKDGLLEKDQFIFLEKKQKTGNRDFCIAQPNETLYDIAQNNGVILQNLLDYNNLSADDHIEAGTKIFLRPQLITDSVQSSDAQTLIANTQSTNSNIHEVQTKESLYSISKKYGVSIEQIKEWNHLQNNHLQIGQKLIISQ